MSARVNIKGQRFGRLVASSVDGKDKRGQLVWRCNCDCGNTVTVNGNHLRSLHTLSCGCLALENASTLNLKHGMTRTRTYQAWANMTQRCTNPARPDYSRYGGRGVSICKRWAEFENFLADMGMCPNGKSLDRYPNNNGDYEPGNCRWGTAVEQQNNKRNNRTYIFEGNDMTVRELSYFSGIKIGTLRRRLETYGWPVDVAVSAKPYYRQSK